MNDWPTAIRNWTEAASQGGGRRLPRVMRDTGDSCAGTSGRALQSLSSVSCWWWSDAERRLLPAWEQRHLWKVSCGTRLGRCCGRRLELHRALPHPVQRRPPASSGRVPQDLGSAQLTNSHHALAARLLKGTGKWAVDPNYIQR